MGKRMTVIPDPHVGIKRKTLYKTHEESYNRRVNRLRKPFTEIAHHFPPYHMAEEADRKAVSFAISDGAERKGAGNGRHVRFRRQASQN